MKKVNLRKVTEWTFLFMFFTFGLDIRQRQAAQGYKEYRNRAQRLLTIVLRMTGIAIARGR